MGDVLLAMDGKPLREKGTFNTLMADKRWSDTASYEVKRGEEKVTLVAKLARKLPDATKTGGGKK